jgi:hypothetical protein
MPGLRPNFVQELDIKTGSFGAEYGRATGGILNVVLKGGSNEFHGSVFTTLDPDFLVSPEGEEIVVAGEAISRKLTPGEGSYNLDFGFEVGGPILKDKLWFYAGFAPVLQNTALQRYLSVNETATFDGAGDATCVNGSPEVANTADSFFADGSVRCVDSSGNYLRSTAVTQDLSTYRKTYQYVGKLTYLLDENNSFTLSGFGSPSARRLTGGNFFAGANNTTYADDSRRYIYQDENQMALFGRWGGKFLDKRLVTEVQAGWFSNSETDDPRILGGYDQATAPVVEWLQDFALSDFESVPGCDSIAGCPVFGYTTGGYGGIFNRDTDRYVAKASAAYLFDAAGQHNLKGGLDLERVRYEVEQYNTGGNWYLYLSGLFVSFRGYGTIIDPLLGPGDIPGLDITTDGAWGTITGSNGTPDYYEGRVQQFIGKNTSQTDSFAYFLQDSWQPSFVKNLTLNYGLRLETQSMKNLDYEATAEVNNKFEINDNWAPRVQAIYDFTGTGRSKVAASWGRFYYAMPLDLGNRSFGNEVSLRYNLDALNCGFTGDPGAYDVTQTILPIAANPATTCTLRARGGVNNDFRLTGGFTPADPDLKGSYVDMFGAQAEYEVMPDVSVGVEWNARRQGYVIEDMSANEAGTYFIGNPGKDAQIRQPDYACATPPCYVNSKGVDSFDYATFRPISIEFPEPERSYDGVTLRVQKLFSRNWLAQASYTYSVLRGNYSGPYYPEYGQLDPGITGEYDLASLMGNKQGLLPGDSTHQLKLYGAYVWTLGPRFSVTGSASYEGFSGNPVSALGSHFLYGSGSSFIVPRGQVGRTPFLHNVNVGGGMEYVIKAPYAVNFRVDLFNVFNDKTELAVDENYTFDEVTPIQGLRCDGTNHVDTGDPAASLQAECPELEFLKTVDGRPVSVNENFGKGITFKAPFSMRLSLALTF